MFEGRGTCRFLGVPFSKSAGIIIFEICAELRVPISKNIANNRREIEY